VRQLRIALAVAVLTGSFSLLVVIIAAASIVSSRRES
jgi:hypothetical protein